ncbi:MAG: hypothetical protein H6519_03330 [Microthrixaceae bacterium]|nr:hypothetical protein [Acidimicrobiales bacterium]MCB9403447.1 hypothetical protein [Microthrixaceae bacterium]
MANRTDTSRDKRARQNRAHRDALAARTKAASTPREERVAAAAPVTSKSPVKADGQAGVAERPSAREALAQGRLGQVPVDIDQLEGSFLRKLVQVPGGLQVVMAAVLAVVLAVMVSFMDTVPPEGAKPGAEATRTLFEAYGASALLYLGPPLVLVGNAVVFGLHAKRRRMWITSAVMLGVFSLFLPQYLFPAGMLGYAALRSKRIEDGPRRPRPARKTDSPDSKPAAED